jgi:hypothetical protein
MPDIKPKTFVLFCQGQNGGFHGEADFGDSPGRKGSGYRPDRFYRLICLSIGQRSRDGWLVY